jgi:hypothetical protein
MKTEKRRDGANSIAAKTDLMMRTRRKTKAKMKKRKKTKKAARKLTRAFP